MRIYKPMLATTASKPFNDINWIFEVKWDGFRALAYVNDSFSLKSRNGNEFNYNFPEITELTTLTHNVVLDGELIILKDGLPDFEAMQKRFQKKCSNYEEGQRSDCWLKIKNLRTCDCIIVGWFMGDNGFSAIMGLYDNQELVHVANVEYGFTGEIKRTLIDFFKEITVRKEQEMTYLKPVVVCEVIYQSVLGNCTLRFPRFHRIRFDKPPIECTFNQIAGIGKCFSSN